MAEGKSGWMCDLICSLNRTKPCFCLCVFCFVLLSGLLVWFWLVGWGFWLGIFWGVVSPIQKTSEFWTSNCQYTRKSLKRHCMECSAGEDGVILLTPTTLLVVKVLLCSAGFFPKTVSGLYETALPIYSITFLVSRFKNVMFDITPGEEVGDFEIKAKFLGVEMEKVQLHFQVWILLLCYIAAVAFPVTTSFFGIFF